MIILLEIKSHDHFSVFSRSIELNQLLFIMLIEKYLKNISGWEKQLIN